MKIRLVGILSCTDINCFHIFQLEQSCDFHDVADILSCLYNKHICDSCPGPNKTTAGPCTLTRKGAFPRGAHHLSVHDRVHADRPGATEPSFASSSLDTSRSPRHRMQHLVGDAHGRHRKSSQTSKQVKQDHTSHSCVDLDFNVDRVYKSS